MQKSLKIEGFFIEFSGEEIEEVKKELELRGYSPDNAGIKELIIDSLTDYDEEPEDKTGNFIGKASKYIKENPEKVKAGIETIGNLINMLAKKARR